MSCAASADIVIALENSETERAVDYMQENQISVNNCVLYGVGNSEKAVYELDKGRIQALLVPNAENQKILFPIVQ